jgi:hypothetical protein
VLDLFSRFERQLSECLLFLKSVRRVVLYARSGGGDRERTARRHGGAGAGLGLRAERRA